METLHPLYQKRLRYLMWCHILLIMIWILVLHFIHNKLFQNRFGFKTQSVIV